MLENLIFYDRKNFEGLELELKLTSVFLTAIPDQGLTVIYFSSDVLSSDCFFGVNYYEQTDFF